MYTPISAAIRYDTGEISVIAGSVFVNILILMCDIHNPPRIVVSVVLSALIVFLQPTRKGVFAVTALACAGTVFHAATNSHVSGMVWSAALLFNPEFHDLEHTIGSAVVKWEDRDGSIKHGSALLTHDTQRAIRVNQNRCHSGRAVYRVQQFTGGMGAELHFHTTVLALAIEHDALFAWGDRACTKYRAHCRQLYEKEHGCSQEQLSFMHAVDFTDWADIKAPMLFVVLLPASFTMAQIQYWWQTQAIGFLARFNSDTGKRIKALRGRLHGNNMSLSGAINVNIRGGDKISESRLSPVETFIDKAMELISAQPLSFSRTLFITSDSLHDILRAKVYANSKKLHVVYSDVPRMKAGNQQDMVDSFWDYNITVSVLMQLSMTSECDAWIGTRSSSWNRVIDIYRCARAFKCKQMFVEAGDTVSGHYDFRPLGFM